MDGALFLILISQMVPRVLNLEVCLEMRLELVYLTSRRKKMDLVFCET